MLCIRATFLGKTTSKQSQTVCADANGGAALCIMGPRGVSRAKRTPQGHGKDIARSLA